MRRSSVSLSAVLLLLCLGDLVAANDIRVEEWRGHDVVRLDGPIEQGLASAMAEALERAEVWAHGARVVLLDSPGGDVDEALRISALFDASPVHTVVPNGARCASACGSILFVAGQYRTVEVSGALGQHSCASRGQPDKECNDEIARHAVSHGVSYGSIGAFVTYTPPEEILWFSREDVDGWGISRYPGEEASGFEKSEPRVLEMLTGKIPPAQSAWRLDFFGDGFRAFLRPASDSERELQLNLFCFESLKGRLFLSIEIHGEKNLIESVIQEVQIASNDYVWVTKEPWVVQSDPIVTSVIVEIPPNLIIPFLQDFDKIVLNVDLASGFSPMRATTYLGSSRENLIFAANNCASGDYDLEGQSR